MRSGNDDNRISYQEMLDRLRKGRFSGIVSDDTSRNTGNQTELHRPIAPLRYSDRFLVTLNGIDNDPRLEPVTHPAFLKLAGTVYLS